MTLPALLLAARKSKGWSQETLAEKAGMDRVYYIRLEKGHTTPRIDTLRKIAKALEVPLSSLIPED